MLRCQRKIGRIRGLFHRSVVESNGCVQRAASSTSLKGGVLAIRREDQSVWERRAPLAPHHVRKLVAAGCRVLVQPSNRRAYPIQTYLSAGAEVLEDISEARLIMGVKQVPVDSLLPDRTYCFFSHTIKAQSDNMPLLDAMLQRNIRLVDYEKMVDERGQRVVAFGKYAGVVGMINIMHGMGLRMLALGHHTPFMHIGPAHNYRNSEMARQAVRDAGYELALGLMPRSIGPLTFVFTGSGNVSQGAQEIIQELPHEYVSPDELKEVAEHGSRERIYCCEVSRPDHLQRRQGGGYCPEEYEKHPELYISTFSTKIAPYVSCLVNGLYWAVNAPRVLTLADAKRLLKPYKQDGHSRREAGEPVLPHRLIALCDISADPGGSIEFMTECTTIDLPFCLYDAELNRDSVSFRGPGVLVCSIDNMPTQLPREATDFFGHLLLPHVPSLLTSDACRPLEEHKFSSVVDGAIITSNGQLTPSFQYIDRLRQNNRLQNKTSPAETARKRRVLVLGSGYVASPLVEYLARDTSLHIQVASGMQSELDSLTGSNNKNNVEPMLLDVSEKNNNRLHSLVKSADVVVSLLPYTMHPMVLRTCIEAGSHLVTASYCSEQMQKQHEAAVQAGVTVVNEVGLDPGIDHLLAMQCFDEARTGGGHVQSFVSYCGALPAPECSENPLRYKFSWSPVGALRNSNHGARYLMNGDVVEVPPGQLLQTAHPINFLPGLSLEGFANRDSTVYSKLYGLEKADTVLRGTLRFSGYSRVVLALQKLGLLSEEPYLPVQEGGPDQSWRQLLTQLLNTSPDQLDQALEQLVGVEGANAVQHLGLLDDRERVQRRGSLLHCISELLQQRLSFAAGERDLVVLRHCIHINWPAEKVEQRDITLVAYGEPGGHSALAKTVGYPCAVATRMVLDGEVEARGMVLPLTPELYRPMLRRLELEGIKATQSSVYL